METAVAPSASAVTGIEPMAVRMMEHAAARHLDRLIIVNKIDAPGVDLPALLGMGLIIAGVLVINLFSKTAGH